MRIKYTPLRSEPPQDGVRHATAAVEPAAADSATVAAPATVAAAPGSAHAAVGASGACSAASGSPTASATPSDVTQAWSSGCNEERSEQSGIATQPMKSCSIAVSEVEADLQAARSAVPQVEKQPLKNGSELQANDFVRHLSVCGDAQAVLPSTTTVKEVCPTVSRTAADLSDSCWDRRTGAQSLPSRGVAVATCHSPPEGHAKGIASSISLLLLPKLVPGSADGAELVLTKSEALSEHSDAVIVQPPAAADGLSLVASLSSDHFRNPTADSTSACRIIDETETVQNRLRTARGVSHLSAAQGQVEAEAREPTAASQPLSQPQLPTAENLSAQEPAVVVANSDLGTFRLPRSRGRTAVTAPPGDRRSRQPKRPVAADGIVGDLAAAPAVRNLVAASGTAAAISRDAIDARSASATRAVDAPVPVLGTLAAVGGELQSQPRPRSRVRRAGCLQQPCDDSSTAEAGHVVSMDAPPSAVVANGLCEALGGTREAKPDHSGHGGRVSRGLAAAVGKSSGAWTAQIGSCVVRLTDVTLRQPVNRDRAIVPSTTRPAAAAASFDTAHGPAERAPVTITAVAIPAVGNVAAPAAAAALPRAVRTMKETSKRLSRLTPAERAATENEQSAHQNSPDTVQEVEQASTLAVVTRKRSAGIQSTKQTARKHIHSSSVRRQSSAEQPVAATAAESAAAEIDNRPVSSPAIREKWVKCTACNKHFIRTSHLARHWNLEHLELVRKFACSTCNRTFHWTSSLNRHLRVHAGSKPFACKICGRTFSQRNNLLAHENVHTGKKAHKCSVCGRHFANACNMKTHMVIHTGEKPFECDVCKRSFTQRGALMRHKSVHGSKRFHCPTCDRAFTQSCSMRRHVRNHSCYRNAGCSAAPTPDGQSK